MKRIVLVGAGHANLHIVAKASDYRQYGVELLLIDPGDFWYSGLATGMLAGQYSADDDRIDPQKLCDACGARFIRDSVASIDAADKLLTLASGKTIEYHWLSLNIGSEVQTRIPAKSDSIPSWPVKPIPKLYELRQALEKSVVKNNSMPAVCVIGGGATGTEIVANLLGLAERLSVKPNVVLLSRSSRLLPHRNRWLSWRVHRLLLKRGALFQFNTSAKLITHSGVLGDTDGEEVTTNCEHAVIAVGLRAKPFNTPISIAASRRGIAVNAAMQSIDDPTIFAAGDCADFQPRPLAKVGVFGVRAAETIHQNLLASINGKPLSLYKPQRHWLAILNLGNGTGLATWWKFWWLGRASLKLKDKIDMQFMRRYRELYYTSDERK